MIFFFGIRQRLIRILRIPEFLCEICKTPTMQIDVSQRYIHIFWIPMIPVGRVVSVGCGTCKNVLTKIAMDERLKVRVKSALQEVGTPVWYFAPVALLVILVAVVSVSLSKDNKDREAYIRDPQSGDIYLFSNRDAHTYEYFRVLRRDGDTVTLEESNYVFSGIFDAKVDENNPNFFDKELVSTTTLDQLMSLKERGVIVGVKRKK